MADVVGGRRDLLGSLPSRLAGRHHRGCDGDRRHQRKRHHQRQWRPWTRGGLNWTKRFPTIAVTIGSIPATGLILDGEVISANERGAANFSALQDDLSKRRYDRMAYYAFDLLYLDGFRPACRAVDARAMSCLRLKLKNGDAIVATAPTPWVAGFD